MSVKYAIGILGLFKVMGLIMAYSFGQTALAKENALPSKISLSLFITKTARPFAC